MLLFVVCLLSVVLVFVVLVGLAGVICFCCSSSWCELFWLLCNIRSAFLNLGADGVVVVVFASVRLQRVLLKLRAAACVEVVSAI